MSGHTYTHTHTQDNYSNPRCACTRRVNYQCKMELGPDFWGWFDKTQFSYIPLCSPNTCKGVSIQILIYTFQSNSAEGFVL